MYATDIKKFLHGSKALFMIYVCDMIFLQFKYLKWGFSVWIWRKGVNFLISECNYGKTRTKFETHKTPSCSEHPSGPRFVNNLWGYWKKCCFFLWPVLSMLEVIEYSSFKKITYAILSIPYTRCEEVKIPVHMFLVQLGSVVFDNLRLTTNVCFSLLGCTQTNEKNTELATHSKYERFIILQTPLKGSPKL